MSLADKIKALPKHGTPQLEPIPAKRSGATPAATYWEHEAYCYREALALAREWIEARPHDEWCERYPSRTDEYLKCGCGRDALLKALEVPK